VLEGAMQRTVETRLSLDEQMLETLVKLRQRMQVRAAGGDEEWDRMLVVVSALIRTQELRCEVTRLVMGLQRVGLTRHTRALMADVLDLS
jgi:hypothetical protein